MKGPTPVGWHFISLFRLCPWKFYLQNIQGIRTPKAPRALLFGSAIHEGLASGFRYVQTKNGSKKSPSKFLEAAFRSSDKFLKENQHLYETYEDYLSDSKKIYPVLESYTDKYFEEDSKHKVLAVEDTWTIPLLNGYFYTVRLDAVLEAPDGSIHILEHKTTSFSSLQTLYAVHVSGQGFAYLYAASKKFPGKRAFLIPDVIYTQKNPGKSASSKLTVQLDRGKPIEHTQDTLNDFAEELVSSIIDITARVQAIQTNEAAPHEAFPRTRESGVCLSYNRPCEYLDICLLKNFKNIELYGFRKEIPDFGLKKETKYARRKPTPKNT